MSMSASGRTTIGFFAPPWHWARLPVAAARAVDILRHRRGADEGDRPDVRVIEERVHRFFAAVDQADDAGRQADLIEQLEDATASSSAPSRTASARSSCRRRSRRA